MQIKKHHIGIAAVLAIIAVIVLAITGAFEAGRHFPYRTLPPPPVPKGQVKPDCGGGNNHVLGECLPQKPGATPATGGKHSALLIERAAFTTGITGPDLSNNDPVYSSGSWAAIRARNRFAYFKSIEGTGFYDSTAGAMAAQAKAHGVLVGGYDFQHVCGVSASGEAAFFVRALRAQGLLGPGTLPPSADSEFGNGSCGGRSWMQTWVNTVYALDGHVCPIDYTGAWWWQPNIGSFWPTCNGQQLVSWVSGYGVSFPFMPSGLRSLDFWQFTDRGFNGASTGDLSAWQHSEATFVSFAHATPPGPSAAQIASWRAARNRAFAAYSPGCKFPQQSPRCETLGAAVVANQQHLWTVPQPGYKRFACFGPTAAAHLGSLVCWIVRPQANYQSHAAAVNSALYSQQHCGNGGPVTFPTPSSSPSCRREAQLYAYFHGRASALVKAFSL